MRGEREKQIFRDTQRARISGWVRDSEAGWLFYGPGGKAYHILSDEARRLEAQGNAFIERLLGPGFVPVPGKGTSIIAVIMPFALPFLVPEKLALVAMPVALVLTLGAISAFNFMNDLIYETSLRGWRRRVAVRLEADARGSVPQPIADKHRRYNLFLVTCLVATLAAFVTIVMVWTQAISDGFMLVVLGFLILVMATDWASRRVDATPRRRKWFD